MKKPFFKNSSGMSLIEVMIVMTIMSMIGLGTATLMKNMFSIQRRSTLKITANEIKANMETMLKNDTAWANSINHAPNFALLGCLIDTNLVGCPHVNPPNWSAQNFAIVNSTGALWYNAILPTVGFAEDSTVCGTFDAAAGAGNDDCPFRYNLFWRAECPGGVGPCRKPQVILQGNMVFNPADPSDPRNRINVDDYQIDIRRGERVRYEPLEIQYSQTTDQGGGACLGGPWPPGQWTTRPLNNVEEYDAGDNIVSINGAAGEFTLRPGTYQCKVVAQAYEALNGFSIQLFDVTNNVPYPAGGGFSGYHTTAYSSGTVTIELTANATLRLQHMCGGPDSVRPPDGAPTFRGSFDMGIPSEAYGNESVFTNITCVRSS